MKPSHFHYFPLALPYLLTFLFLLIFVIVLTGMGLLEYAYAKIGISPQYVLSVLLLSLLGSDINIPVAEMPAKEIFPGQEVPFFGIRYVIPVVEEWPRTVIAVNLGGAVIPTLLSFYLLVRNQLCIQGFVAAVIVAAIVHWIARPVPGVGIAVPTLVPPLIAVITSAALSQQSDPALA